MEPLQNFENAQFYSFKIQLKSKKSNKDITKFVIWVEQWKIKEGYSLTKTGMQRCKFERTGIFAGVSSVNKIILFVELNAKNI